MYSTVGLLKNAKGSGGKIIGTHQKLDKAARLSLTKIFKKKAYFPSYREIVRFEGNHGPDGLKRKSPGVDEPMHFILPDNDDGKLWHMIESHQYNLTEVLDRIDKKPKESFKKDDQVRAAFEAAWLAHAVVDGLTPAHHFPYEEAVKELMSDNDYVTIFGQPIKGIMPGENLAEMTINNWRYWGPEGYMSKHIAFEYRVAIIATAIGTDSMAFRPDDVDYEHIDLKKEFYDALHRINDLDMYGRFRENGWTKELRDETKNILLPELVRMTIVAWAACMPQNKLRIKLKEETAESQKSKQKAAREAKNG